MPVENYKKLIIAVILVLVAGVLIFAVTNSNRKEDKSPFPAMQKGSAPPGPLRENGATVRKEDLPDNPEELALLGDKYFEAGNYNEAVQAYEKAIQLSPNDVDTYNDLGLALHYLKRSDAAEEILRKGTRVNPSYQRIWLSLGFVLMSTGQQEEAKTILRKVAAMDPGTDIGMEAKKLLNSVKWGDDKK